MRLDHITPKQFDVCVSDGEVDKPKICKNSQTNHIPNSGKRLNRDFPTELLDDHRALEPPDPIPNSVVKRRIADGSVGFPHVRVGHRQASIPNPSSVIRVRGLSFARPKQGRTGFYATRGDIAMMPASSRARSACSDFVVAFLGPHPPWLQGCWGA